MKVPQTPAPQAVAPAARSAPSSAEIYRALVSQQDILSNQVSQAQRTREQLVNQLSSGDQSATTKISLEKRIANIDANIADLDLQMATANKAVATAAGVPGATTRPPQPPRNGPPEEAYALGALFMFIAILPMSIAFARRIWRRSARAEVTLPPEMSQRMESLERGMDAIALEVERIGEGQRFMTTALTERAEIRAVGAGAAQPIPIQERERVDARQLPGRP